MTRQLPELISGLHDDPMLEVAAPYMLGPDE
jgi:hypothetical protein